MKINNNNTYTLFRNGNLRTLESINTNYQELHQKAQTEFKYFDHLINLMTKKKNLQFVNLPMSYKQKSVWWIKCKPKEL